MKNNKSIISVLFVLSLVVLVISCAKDLEDEGIFSVTEYIGTVVENSTMQPIEGVRVSITDGEHVYASTETDAQGAFAFKEVNTDELTSKYRLFLDGSPIGLPTKEEELKGFGSKLYDFKAIVLYDKTNDYLRPTITATTVSNVAATSVTCKAKVTKNQNALDITDKGFVWNTSQYPLLDTTSTNYMSFGAGEGEMTGDLTSLTQNLTYFVRAYAVNSIGTTYGEQASFITTLGLAILTINAVSDISATSAVCGGTIVSNAGYDITDKGLVWSTSQFPTVNDNKLSLGSGNTAFTSSMTNLSMATTYYVRAYAINSNGTAYSDQLSFTTTDGLPKITTTAISNITASSAKSGGNVISNNGYPVTARGVCWNTTGNPDINDQFTSNGNGNGTFSSNLTGLTAGTTYYVRAYATNQNGTTYGSQLVFSTLSGNATISLNEATNVTSSTATCSANITNDGGDAITERGFCWATSQYPSITNSHTSVGSGTGEFSSSLINLTPTVTYYVRAYATNSFGTSYSNQISFTTTNGLPTVTTGSTTNITATSAVCSGNVTSDGGFSVTEKGFCWSTSQYPTTSGTHSSAGSGVGSFNGSMSGLSIGTTYYVRAYATNSVGTAYGEQVSFTTANGLPTVTTTAVSMSNGTAVSGGNVTSDGGFAVIARGICYGTLPNPDLTSNYTHTSDGSGTGYFSSTISQSMTGTIYVRAYATNVNGTSYGNQITVDYDYLALPTFSFNGHTYKVAPDPGTLMTWTNANSYCQNLTLYGYSDWRLPTKEELLQMCTDKASIGGFGTSDSGWKNVWSSTATSSYYYFVKMNDCSTVTESGGYTKWVRPIRMEN